MGFLSWRAEQEPWAMVYKENILWSGAEFSGGGEQCESLMAGVFRAFRTCVGYMGCHMKG